MSPAPSRVVLALALSAVASTSARPQAPPGAADEALAAELARWNGFVAKSAPAGGILEDARKAGGPVLARAEQALRDGRRLLAIQRLVAAREVLMAAEYVSSREAAVRSDPSRFEAEWKAAGESLAPQLGPPAPDSLGSLAPAALRAIGEAALPQVRVYYEASLDYGRATVFDSGLYYVGSAYAQRELPALLGQLADPAALPQPKLRSLEPELAAIESEILAAYRPPASIDRHADFIRASAAVKEARELDALGLRYGALLRYLQAVQRFGPVRAAARLVAASPGEPGLGQTLAGFDARLQARERDHSIGRLFLETAQALAAPGEGSDPAAARAIADSVLPRYFAALEPAGPAAPKPRARATVTLVRWPYT